MSDNYHNPQEAALISGYVDMYLPGQECSHNPGQHCQNIQNISAEISRGQEASCDINAVTHSPPQNLNTRLPQGRDTAHATSLFIRLKGKLISL